MAAVLIRLTVKESGEERKGEGDKGDRTYSRRSRQFNPTIIAIARGAATYEDESARHDEQPNEISSPAMERRLFQHLAVPHTIINAALVLSGPAER